VLSVIVLAYNNMEVSRRCLESVINSELPSDCELLLVDNASTDLTPELAKEFSSRFRNFVYIRNDVNLLCSIAFNKAASIASGDYLLFLNNDIVVGSQSIAALLRAMINDSSAGLAGGKLFYPERRQIQHAGIVPMLWGYPINLGSGAAAEDPRFNNEVEAFAVTGAMLLVRRSVFAAVHGFEEEYRWGLEDVDLCLKVKTAGGRILYLPDAEAIHHESLTVGRNEPRTLANHQLFRKRWDALLTPREKMYVDSLIRDGVRRVVIFGTGKAAGKIFEILSNSKISVVGFATSSDPEESAKSLLGKRVYCLDKLADVQYDAMIVGSQFFYTFENSLPRGARFPIV
jgi:GT2 family glycosyltransferase